MLSLQAPASLNVTVPAPRQRAELLVLHEATQHRHFTCATYDSCLTKAANLGWRSFSCAACPYWPPTARPPPDAIPLDLDEDADDTPA